MCVKEQRVNYIQWLCWFLYFVCLFVVTTLGGQASPSSLSSSQQDVLELALGLLQLGQELVELLHGELWVWQTVSGIAFR